MSSLAISPRDRKTLAAGVLGILAIVGSARGIPVWREWDEQSRGSARELSLQVAALKSQLRHLSVLRDSARALTVSASAERERLLEASTVGIGGAALATRITDVADELGIRVSAVQIRPDSLFRSGYARVAVSLTASGDVTHLTDLLQSLESSDALLAVRELTVTPGDVLTPDGRPETLRFQVLVEGLVMKSKPDSAIAESHATKVTP
jgi:hypothetical protein